MALNKKVLIIDTTNIVMTITLLRENRAEILRNENQRTHDEAINGMTGKILAKHGLGLGDIDVYAVVIGPGSWTGSRVGIAAIKGYHVIHPRPIIALNSLDIRQGKGNMPVALHSGGDNYFIKCETGYSYEKLYTITGYLTMDNTSDIYLNNMLELTGEKYHSYDFTKIEELDPFYVTEFKVNSKK